jgi:arginyl-tRNA synthetase
MNGIAIKASIKAAVESALYSLYSEPFLAKQYVPQISIDRPADITRGDYTTSIALAAAKIIGITPIEFAIAVISKLNEATVDHPLSPSIEKIEAAGAGFINFYLKPDIIASEVNVAAHEASPFTYGKITINAGKKIAYEYTDPNPFKVFHIGHLVANITGETISRLGEFTNAEIKRFCYQGDLGRHVALFIYGLRLMDAPFPDAKEGEKMTLVDRMYYMGTAYAKGATYIKQNLESNPDLEQEIQVINKKLYERSDEEVNAIYDLGLEWSLEYFETLYALLGTKFDQYFFESKCVEPARALISEGLAKGIFAESDGAIVFEGEKFQDKSKGEHLHTRVFITKIGLPTYDAKELGLAKLKYDAFPYDRGIIVTGNEQDQYFQVNLKAQELMLPQIIDKNSHVSHGMMRLPTGKMSSRTGDVVSAEEMIESAREFVLEVMKDRPMAEDERKKIANQVAIAGLKYLVLRQASGKDIVYDAKKALTFDGDSGPYLQYACVRARSVVAKAKEQGIEPVDFSIACMSSPTCIPNDASIDSTLGTTVSDVARKVFVFPEIIERAYLDTAPHHVATYLIELAGMFNAFYAQNKIIDVTNDATRATSAQFVALTQAVANVLANGLYVLGIEVPERM